MLSVAVLAFLVADWLPRNQYADTDVIRVSLSSLLGGIAVALAIKDRLGPVQTRRVMYAAVAMLLALAVALSAAEAVTRRAFASVTTTANNGGYFSRRWLGSKTIQVNAAGFREREFATAKPAGRYRIAVIGDSFTFGNGVAQYERYSDLLQSWLGDDFETLNFGVPGANTPDHLGTLISHVLPTQPDFVLLQWYVNDAEGDVTSGRPTVSPLVPGRHLHNWVLERSAAYTVANIRWSALQAEVGLSDSYATYMQRRLSAPQGADAIREREILRDFIVRCRDQGVRVGMVLFPDSGHDLGPRYPYQYLHDRVREVCRDEDVTCLDLREPFARIKNRQSLWVNPFDAHPSVRANAIAAAAILTVFESVWRTPAAGK